MEGDWIGGRAQWETGSVGNWVGGRLVWMQTGWEGDWIGARLDGRETE